MTDEPNGQTDKPYGQVREPYMQTLESDEPYGQNDEPNGQTAHTLYGQAGERTGEPYGQISEPYSQTGEHYGQTTEPYGQKGNPHGPRDDNDVRAGPQTDVKTDKSYEVMRENSKRSTEEEELRSLSTTPRMSHEDYGRVVSPPHSPYDQETGLMEMGDNFREIMYDAETVRRDLTNQQAQRRKLEGRLQEVEEEKKDLNMKLAALRVKLGVANANSNVSKNECEKMRKDLQDTQIKKARLEERIKSCSRDIERLSDPGNPDSNVNMKKMVVNDRKEIRRLRTELDGVKTERSQVQVEILDRDSKIRRLHAEINEARDRLDTCQSDFDVAKISALSERKKREEVEEKHAELVKEKSKFDNSVEALQSQLNTTIADTAEIQQSTEKSKEKEEALLTKISSVERKLKDVLTEIEQQKNRNMPVRTASSIKYHQYRMTRSGVVSETTPHVIVTANPKGSIAASGYLGKSVSVRKTATSLPAKSDRSSGPVKGSGSSFPAKK